MSKDKGVSFAAWLDSEPGRVAAVARHFQVSQSAVCQWREKGVPRARMLEVRRLSRNQVSLAKMLEGKA